MLEELRGTRGHKVTTFYLADCITGLLLQAIQTKLEDEGRNVIRNFGVYKNILGHLVCGYVKGKKEEET